MEDNGIVILSNRLCSSGRIVYNELSKNFNVVKIVLEDKQPKMAFILKRFRKLGLWIVIGQVFFKYFLEKILNYLSRNRIKAIMRTYHLDDSSINRSKVMFVDSINEEKVARELQALQPKVIIVVGTRILKKNIINCTKTPIINIHAGVTPCYRGVHGGYWALANNDKANCGVTIHLVDKGIDTGAIIYQDVINPTDKDNFVTYPMLQLGVGLPLLVKAVSDVLSGNLKTYARTDIDSKLWTHPTIYQYINNQLVKGVH